MKVVLMLLCAVLVFGGLVLSGCDSSGGGVSSSAAVSTIDGTIVSVSFPKDGMGGAMQTKDGMVVQFTSCVPNTFQIGVPAKITIQGRTITAIDPIVTAPAAAPPAADPTLPPFPKK